MTQRADEEVPVRREAVQLAAEQDVGESRRGGSAGRRPDDDLREHAVVVRAHERAVAVAGIHTHIGRIGDAEAVERPARREEALRDILRVQAPFDRVAGESDVAHGIRKRTTGSDLELEGHEVKTGHELRHRVLDLEAGVHLEEPERPRRIQHELDRARADVADRPRRGHRGSTQLRTERGIHRRGRRLLDHLLMTTLDRALAFEEVHHSALGVAEDLHLHVPRRVHEALEEDRAVAERPLGLTLGTGDRLLQCRVLANDAHAPPTAPELGLDQQGEPDLVGRLREICGPRVGRHHDAGQDGHPRLTHAPLRLDLGPHRVDDLGRRTDERQPCRIARAGEPCVLGQEAVPRVHRVGAGGACRAEYGLDVEVRLARSCSRQSYRDIGVVHVRKLRVGVGEHRDRHDAEAAGGADDPARDLSAIRDQESRDFAHVGAITCGRRRSRVGRVPRSSGWPTARSR